MCFSRKMDTLITFAKLVFEFETSENTTVQNGERWVSEYYVQPH